MAVFTPGEERFVALLKLGGAGDALGYKGGDWEFCRSLRKMDTQRPR